MHTSSLAYESKHADWNQPLHIYIHNRWPCAYALPIPLWKLIGSVLNCCLCLSYWWRCFWLMNDVCVVCHWCWRDILVILVCWDLIGLDILFPLVSFSKVFVFTLMIHLTFLVLLNPIISYFVTTLNPNFDSLNLKIVWKYLCSVVGWSCHNPT